MTLTEGTRCANKYDRAMLKHRRTANRCKTHQSFPFSVPFSDPLSSCLFLHYLFQEYQHWSDIQNKVLLADTSWSLARNFPWSIKYSLSSSCGLSLQLEEKLQIEYFVCFWHICSLRLVLCGYTSLHLQWFYWQHPSPFCIFLWHHTSFYPQDDLFQQLQVARNFCFLAMLNNCRNLTLQYTQTVEVFLMYSLIYNSCFGWTRDLFSPFFPFVVLSPPCPQHVSRTSNLLCPAESFTGPFNFQIKFLNYFGAQVYTLLFASMHIQKLVTL